MSVRFCTYTELDNAVSRNKQMLMMMMKFITEEAHGTMSDGKNNDKGLDELNSTA